MWTILRHNALTVVISLICCMSVIYDVFIADCQVSKNLIGVGQRTVIKSSSNSLREQDSRWDTSYSTNNYRYDERNNDFASSRNNNPRKKSRDFPKVAVFKETQKENRKKFPETPSTILEQKATKFPVFNKWSSTWPRINIGNCSHIEYMNRGINSKNKIQPRSYPRTGIVSFPGSGNTWSRHLIQQATGLWTGSVYHDKSLFNGGFRGELDDCEDRGTVAVKAHYPPPEQQEYCKFERAVIVVRDPYRAILAEFNWRATSKHTGVADPRLYKTKLWMQHVLERTEKWLSTSITWIERFHKGSNYLKSNDNPFESDPAFSKTILLVSYERMKRNATREMERVVKFLGLDQFRRQCVQIDQDGNFHRSSATSESIECLFKKFNLISTVEKKIRSLAKRMKEIGLGDITAEFEGPGGEVESEKCRHV